MTLSIDGFVPYWSEPLNHARILWNPASGTVAADGAGGALAQNEFTAQRWVLGAGSQAWTLTLPAAAPVDCVFVAAHNLAGCNIVIATSPTTSAAFTTRATILPGDNGTIAALFTDRDGNPISARRVRLTVTGGGATRTAGIIRVGKALELPIPIYGGHGPISWNRRSEIEPQVSETGQWLGATIKRRSLQASYAWEYLAADWYAENFEPFAQTLPARPFGIIGNPSLMGQADVGWCRALSDPSPQNMGVRNYLAVSLDVTGFWS